MTMLRCCLVAGALASALTGVAAGSQSHVEARSVAAYPGKSGGGPLYASFAGAGAGGYRDNSYEDNAVTPASAPSLGPLYRPQQQQQPLVYRKPALLVDAGSGSREQQQPSARQPQQRVQVGGQIANRHQQAYILKNGQLKYKLSEEELAAAEDQKEEPDRLSLLLPQSRFDCVGKQTGYYADEELNCEVFHYCQDNARHSWICPEGFTFHQVHLICMPSSSGAGNGAAEISCKKSSQYHFVNDYLYKPLNLQEAESRPNVTLRYSERYFPADVYTDERDSGSSEHQQQYRASSVVQQQHRRPGGAYHHHQHHQPSVQLGPTINSIFAAAASVSPSSTAAPSSPSPQYRIPINQVFRSPEEVNIPLQQRRPAAVAASSSSSSSSFNRRQPPQVRPDDDEYD